MKLDTLLESHGAGLRHDLESRPSPPTQNIAGRARRERRRRLAIAAAVSLVIAATVGIGVSRREPAPASPPSGVTPQQLTDPTIGFTVQVPNTWNDSSKFFGYQFSYTGPVDQGFITAGIQPDASTLDVATDQWLARVVLGGPPVSSRRQVALDHQPAVEVRFTVPNAGPRGGTLDDTTYIVRNRTGRLIQITIGARAPRQSPELLAWITRTIRLR